MPNKSVIAMFVLFFSFIFYMGWQIYYLERVYPNKEISDKKKIYISELTEEIETFKKHLTKMKEFDKDMPGTYKIEEELVFAQFLNFNEMDTLLSLIKESLSDGILSNEEYETIYNKRDEFYQLRKEKRDQEALSKYKKGLNL